MLAGSLHFVRVRSFEGVCDTPLHVYCLFVVGLVRYVSGLFAAVRAYAIRPYSFRTNNMWGWGPATERPPPLRERGWRSDLGGSPTRAVYSVGSVSSSFFLRLARRVVSCLSLARMSSMISFTSPMIASYTSGVSEYTTLPSMTLTHLS